MFDVRSLSVAAGLMGLALALPLDAAHASRSHHVSSRHAVAFHARHHTSSRYAIAAHGRHHASSRHAVASRGGRPARWCGWWMRTQKGGGPELNLAANWKHWGRPSGPRVGAVVVWSHHVGEITGRAASGEWIVRSGNDGGQVRERPRSVVGAVFRI